MTRLLRGIFCLSLVTIAFAIAASAAEDVDGQDAPRANQEGKQRPDQPAANVTFSPRPVYVGAREGVDPPVDVTPTLTQVAWADVTFVSADATKFTVTKLADKVRIVGKAATDRDGVELQAKADGKIVGKVSVIVIMVDLDIANGGSDLDNGEDDNSPPSSVLPEVDEGDPTGDGAYLLVNWDDDDGDGSIKDDGSGWDSDPIPDLNENPVENEDNLAKLVLSPTPALSSGSLELLVLSGASHVKIWDSPTKNNEITDLDWDLSTETPPTELWLEGRSFSSEKGVELRLRYEDSASNEIAGDSVKATVVLIRLGAGLHREMAGWPKERGHAGLLTSFTGECTKTDLLDSAKYGVTEMQKTPDDCVTTTWKALHNAAPVYWGQYESGPTYAQRLKILLVARYILDDTGSATAYCLNDVLNPHDWGGDLDDVESLRCDGLVELAHEWSGLNAWGKVVGTATHYSIISFLDEHNEFLVWKKNLFLATQCARESTYKGANWDTAFSLTDAVKPLGPMNW